LKFFLTLIVLVGMLVAGCGSNGDSPNGSTAIPTPTRQAEALLTPPPAIRPVSFPRDEAPHDNMTEWWYYTGHMFDEDGNRYGFEYVIFQVQRGSFPAFFASHFAITDNEAGSFVYDQKSGFQGKLDSDVGFHLKIGDWEMQGANGRDALKASMEGYAIDVMLSTDEDPILHNMGTGYMDIGMAGGSYYYSRPGMKLSGQLTVNGEKLDVTGSAWMDHQWGDFVLVNGGGWDWFAVELDDGTALMVFQLRGVEGVGDLPDFGTLVLPDQTVIHLDEADYTIESGETWLSDLTGANYPLGWTITIPTQELTLQLDPSMADQELDTRASTGTIYWEGEVTVSGTHSGDQVAGLGYVELTGYAEAGVLSP
jgi:predicted secreted hydrolase